MYSVDPQKGGPFWEQINNHPNPNVYAIVDYAKTGSLLKRTYEVYYKRMGVLMWQSFQLESDRTSFIALYLLNNQKVEFSQSLRSEPEESIIRNK